MNQFKITSFETFSAVDGPGIRTVIFLSGCPNRCIYCHNPECFLDSEAKMLSFEELKRIYKNYEVYYKQNGGLTFSGGEPLLQAKEINEFNSLYKVNYALETSGSVLNDDAKKVLSNSSFVYLDLKFNSIDLYKKYVGNTFNSTIKVLKYLEDNKIEHVIRQVVIPGINDSYEALESTIKLLKSNYNSRTIEFLPYHNMCQEKYDRLNLDFKLKGVKSLDNAYLNKLKDELSINYLEFNII